MFMLTVLGVLLVATMIYWFIEWFNAYAQKEGNYHFFSAEHTMAFVASYLIIFFGYRLMENHWMGDALNGGIILVIGISILVFTILNNFKSTKRSLAIKGTVAQLILYIPIAAVGLLILVAAFAFFSQTKPVYNINSND